MAVIKGITVYIPLYDKWGNSIGQIELEPRLVDGLPKQGSRKGELIFNTQDSALYYWDGERWRGLGAAATTITRDDVVDFWAEPFWENIPDKPSEFPPEPHTHTVSDITDIEGKYTKAENGGQHIWVQSTEPTAKAVGDIWIQTE